MTASSLPSPEPVAVMAQTFHAPSIADPNHAFPVEAEIRRSIRLERWLEGLDPASLITARKPRVDESLISVVLPMFNASPWIETTLKSLLVQPDNIEIFCVDDASTDDTFERVRRAFGADSRVCAIRLEENVGPYQIRNWVAAHLARGKWLAFQDADDFSHPNRFALKTRLLGRHNAIACGSCVHQFFPANIEPRRGNTVIHENQGLLHNLCLYANAPRARQPRPMAQQLLEREPSFSVRTGGLTRPVPSNDSPAMYASLVVRRRNFLDLGGFDGRTRIGADRLFSLRLLRFHSIANVPAVLYSRRIHARSLTQRRETGYRSPMRLDLWRLFDAKERILCRVMERGTAEQVRQLCTSDLYHAGIRVADVRGGFTRR